MPSERRRQWPQIQEAKNFSIDTYFYFSDIGVLMIPCPWQKKRKANGSWLLLYNGNTGNICVVLAVLTLLIDWGRNLAD